MQFNIQITFTEEDLDVLGIFSSLTPIQQTIAELSSKGLTVKDIADARGVTSRTTEAQLGTIKHHFALTSRALLNYKLSMALHKKSLLSQEQLDQLDHAIKSKVEL